MFKIGDTVYFPHTINEQRQHPCPDCLGKRTWHVRSPAGGVYTAPCPRCTGGYRSVKELSLYYHFAVPVVSKMTIGMVRAMQSDEGNQNEYMCRETGIGSGSVYTEEMLTADKDEAEAIAEYKANKINNDAERFPGNTFHGNLEFADYQLHHVSLKAARDLTNSIRGKYNWYLCDLEECETMEDVKEHIELYKEKEGVE